MNLKQTNNIPKHVTRILHHVFNQYAPSINQVILFGSRARGDFKPTSDIDLAIKFRKNNDKLLEIAHLLNDSPIVYKIDIVDFDSIQHSLFKKNIEKEGVVIFSTNEKGEVQLTMNSIQERFVDFEKALMKLHQSLARDIQQDDLALDATIQRFEFTYELAWKVMKKYLEYNGVTDIASPRATIRAAFQNGLLTDGETWLIMLQDRNRTSHTYNEETALEIYSHIQQRYIHLLDALVIEMKKRLEL